MEKSKKKIFFALGALALVVIAVLLVQRSQQGKSLEEVVVAPGDHDGSTVSDATSDSNKEVEPQSHEPAEPGGPVLIGGESEDSDSVADQTSSKDAAPSGGIVGNSSSKTGSSQGSGAGTSLGMGAGVPPQKGSETLQGRSGSPSNAQSPFDVAKEEPGCRILKFSHDNVESHKDGSLCLEHSNEIALPEDLKNPSFVCVRVNDQVVDFKLNRKGPKTIVRFGPGAGIGTLVEITACIKGAKACRGGCPKKKSRFVASMGLDEDGGRGKLDDQVEREYARLEAAIGLGAKELDLKFKGWKFVNDVAGCKK
jgi:hypothetical protein